MWDATTNLRLLEDELGEQAHLLQYAPFKYIVVEPLQDEPQAISSKILLGYIKSIPAVGTKDKSSEDKDDEMPVLRNNLHKVWAYLYPARTPGAKPEIHFHSFGARGGHIGREDGENISKAMYGCASAFAMPSRHKWSMSKLTALVKYYFLRILAETNSQAEAEIMRYGIPMSKTFKEELLAVCRGFRDSARRLSGTAPRIPAAKDSLSHDRALSEPPELVFDELVVESNAPITVERDSVVPSNTSLHNALESVPVPPDKIIEDFIELCRNEQAAMDDLERIKKEMNVLEMERVSKEEEQTELKKRKMNLLQGMSAQTAFTLGHRMGRDGAQKRMRQA